MTSWLGRDWNSRAGGGRAGQRNGFGDVTVKTTAGPVGAEAPEAAQHRRGVRVAAAGQGRGAYGTTTVGRPVLLAVEPGGDESHDAWAGFLEDLAARGLRPPAAGGLRRGGGPDRRHRHQDGLRTAPNLGKLYRHAKRGP